MSAAASSLSRCTPLVLSLAAIASVVACTAGDLQVTTTAPADVADAATSTSDPTSAPAGGDGASTSPPPPPCDETKMSALQAALDGAHPDDTNAVLAVKSASCGVRFYASGPSKAAPTDLHRIASVTKTYVGGLILKLAEQGVVSLDAPVSKWVDGVPGGESVKVRHLLQHTSGLNDFDDTLSWQAGLLTKRKWQPRDLAELAFSRGLKSTPGTKWEYANSNFVVLGLVAEAAAGKPIEVLLRSQVFDAIGAKATFLAGLEPIPGALAPGENGNGGDVTNYGDPSSWWVSGNIVATPEDVLTWIEKLGSGQFVSPAMNVEMKKTVSMGTVGYDYGLSVAVIDGAHTAGGGPGYGHSGSLPGYHSWALYFPEPRTTVFAMSNADPAKTGGEVLSAALKVLFGGGDAGAADASATLAP